jgi:hypothetical protein
MNQNEPDKQDDNLRLSNPQIERLDDLALEDEAQITGGSFAGQTVRLRIASTNNQGKL